MVRDLTNTLVEAMSMGVIPIGLKVQILDPFGLQRPANKQYSLDSKKSTPSNSRSQVRSSRPILPNIHPHTFPISGAQRRPFTTMHELAVTISKTKVLGWLLSLPS
jgi:hypothetical protein